MKKRWKKWRRRKNERTEKKYAKRTCLQKEKYG
jgi:hypothetical protein